MAEERCVCCGETIPEGRMVCASCERAGAAKPQPIADFDGRAKTGSVRVKNADIITLSEILPTMQLINSIEKRYAWQKDSLFSITRHMTGMPRGTGGDKGMDAVFAALDEMERDQNEKSAQYIRRLKKAERILNGIESLTMRAFVVMKYVMDLPDTEIQKELGMSKWSFNRARNAVESAPDMASVKWREKFILSV